MRAERPGNTAFECTNAAQAFHPEARAGALASDRVALVCADALDPPLVPESFQRVAALNVLDSVPDPAQLLSVADGLLAPGGELILACPYAFQTGIVEEDARFGGAEHTFMRDALVGEKIERQRVHVAPTAEAGRAAPTTNAASCVARSNLTDSPAFRL